MRGGRELTRVDDSTVLRRGKSEMPASRMEIEESRREREERSEVTDALSEAADEDCVAIVFWVWCCCWRRDVLGWGSQEHVILVGC
jgi:hypothetical protein